jgi:tight adherence protein C
VLATSILVFFAVVLAVLGLANLLSPNPLRARLERLTDGSSAGVERNETHAGGPLDPLGRVLGRVGERFGRGPNGRLRQRLIEAGYRTPGALPRFLGLQLVLAAGLPALLLLLPELWTLGYARVIAALCSACAIGFVIPSYALDKRRARRQLEIDHGLPDVLDLMVVCVEAGLGLAASLTRVAREFARANPVLSAEFELVHLECRAGKRTTDALRAMAERNDVADLRSLVAMLVQTERFGTSLADSLRIHADAMRSRRMQRAEEAAQRAPVKMLFPAALFIFPATLMVTIGPGLLALFDFFGSKAS